MVNESKALNGYALRYFLLHVKLGSACPVLPCPLHLPN